MNYKEHDVLSCVHGIYGIFTQGREYTVVQNRNGLLCVVDDNGVCCNLSQMNPYMFTQVTNNTWSSGLSQHIASLNNVGNSWDEIELLLSQDAGMKIEAVKCECGAEKVKDSAHSRWCKKYE